MVVLEPTKKIRSSLPHIVLFIGPICTIYAPFGRFCLHYKAPLSLQIRGYRNVILLREPFFCLTVIIILLYSKTNRHSNVW